jgi:uncharacterized cofD-like protein
MNEVASVPKDFSVVALGGGHGLAVTLRALRRVTDRLTAIVGVADDGGSSGRLRHEYGILPPGDLRMALAALCAEDHSARQWADVLQYRFAGTTELGGHAVGNVLMAALWERNSDPVAGLDELAELLGAVGRVLPCSLDPLEIVAEISGVDGDREQVRGQVAVATTSGRVERVWLEPQDPRACREALWAIDEADAIVLGPGSWFTSLMPHLLLAEQRKHLEGARGTKILVVNLDPQEGETSGFSPAEHIDALVQHAPGMRFDCVLADSRHLNNAGHLADFQAACRHWDADIRLVDVAGHGDRHDPAKLAHAFDTVLP